MTTADMGPFLAVEGTTTAGVFRSYVCYVERVLAPSSERLRAGQIVVMDNFIKVFSSQLKTSDGAYRPKRVRELIEERGYELLYLPAYSPDYNSIEEASAKIKGLLRRAAARSKEALVEARGTALPAVSARDAWGFFEHAGYRPAVQLP